MTNAPRDTPTSKRLHTAESADDEGDDGIRSIREIDETGRSLPIPVSPVKTFAEEDFLPPPSKELPSERFRRRANAILLPLMATVMASGLGLIVAAGEAQKGLGVLTVAVVPVIVSIIAALFPEKKPAKEQYRHISRAMVVSLLTTLFTIGFGLPFLGEGLICVLFALPVTLSMSALGAGIFRPLFRRRLEKLDKKAKAALGLLVLLLVPWGGPALDRVLFFDDEHRATIVTSHVLPLGQDDAWEALRHIDLTFAPTRAASFDALLPQPLAMTGEGADVGAVREVHFHNGVILATVTGMKAPHTYEINFDVRATGREFFDHWIDLRHSRFDLVAIGPATTRLDHISTYRPRLYPRFFFAPLEQRLGTDIQARLVETWRAQLPKTPSSQSSQSSTVAAR